MLRVDCLGDQIDSGLIGGQIPLGWAGEADGTIDDDLAVVIDQLAQLWDR